MPVRVLHAVEAFGGGLLEVVKQLAIGGAREGEEAAIAHGARPEAPLELGELVGSGVEMLPVSGWTSRSAKGQLWAARELRRVVSTWAPDVVHLHSSFAGLTGSLSLRGVPLVFSPQAFASTLAGRGRIGAAAFRLAESMIVRRATVTVASCPSEARYARERLQAPSVVVIENGIKELDDPPQAPPARSEAVVVAAGRLVNQRQPESCARILGRVADLARVRWVGDLEGDRRERGIAALRENGVELHGWLAREEFLSELARASVYLHWTASDGQPLSILEAMAVDVPVVASAIPPSRDLLSPNQIAGDEDEAVALIRRMLSDRSFAERSLAAQRRQRARHSARRMIAEHLALYRTIGARSAD